MTAKDYIFYKTSCIEKNILKYKLCRVADTSKKVPDLNCEVHDRVPLDLKEEVPDLRSGGIPRI